MAIAQSRHDGHRRVRVNAEDPPEVMLQLTEQDFYNLVDKDIRGSLDPALAEKLRDMAVVERWYQTLLRMKRAVEGLIAARKAENKAFQIQLRNGYWADEKTFVPRNPIQADQDQADFLKSRASSLRFKTGVEERLTEAAWRRRTAVANMLRSAAQLERNELAKQVDHLNESLAQVREMIEKHRIDIDPEDATEMDETLWTETLSLIDQVLGEE